MSYDINEDPALPDWDEDAELTASEAKRTSDSIVWAITTAGESATQTDVEACEREARQRRQAMTPTERAEDDRQRDAVVQRERPEYDELEREYLDGLAGQCGLTMTNQTESEVLEAHHEWARKRHAMFEKLSDEEATAVMKQEGLFQST